MSYNGYNQYSPYWQPVSGQTTPQSAGQTLGRPGTFYQPLGQNNQQSAQHSVSQSGESSSAASYNSRGYGNMTVNAAGNRQDTRADYWNINDRASLDGATALGNLASASRRGVDSPVPQVPNYNRPQSNANYGSANSYGVNSASQTQYQTSDKQRGSIGSSREDNRSEQATASPSFGYGANKAGHQEPSAGNSTHVQPQYLQTSRSFTEQHRNGYSQPSRPPSLQATQHFLPKVGSEPVPLPTISNQITPSQAQVRKNSGSVRRKEPTEGHTPHSDKRSSSSQIFRGATQESQDLQAAANSPAKSANYQEAAINASAKELAVKRINQVQQSPAVDLRRDQASKPTAPMEPQYTTVDPSQVFNHVEYSRRQAAAAAAEAAAIKKAAEETEAAKYAATEPKLATSQANATEPDSAKRDRMELEMKQMIERMREYKAKDPSLFTEIWESVKKSQPPQRAPSQSPQGSATSPIVINGQLPSPGLIHNQIPPVIDLPAGDEVPPGLDRGRFPAQRRRRVGGVKVSASSNSSTPNGSTRPAADNQRSPVPPKTAFPAPKVGQIFPDPGSQSMQQAMQQFHQNSKSPVAKAQQIPDSNKQVTKNTSTDLPNATSRTHPYQPVLAKAAPPSKPGGTYWPESKKRALAEAAQIALTSRPANQKITITTEEIHELLDNNPSYIQMCEILEYRGFVIDRGEFARVLLKAVPDLGSASSSTDTAATSTPNANHAKQNNATSASTPSANRVKQTSATPTVTALDNHTTTTKASSAAPTAGSFGKLVKTISNSSAAQTEKSQPLPHIVPPTAVLQLPNGDIRPEAPAPPSAEQVSKSNPSNGPPRGYRFIDPIYWARNQPPHHVKLTNQGHLNESALPPSFPLYQQPGSVNGQFLDQNGTHPTDVIPPHPTKREMARKRTFEEIVDLTQTLSDDEELERHRSRPRTDHESASGPSKSVNSISNQVAQRQQNSGRTTPKPFEHKYSGRDALLQSHGIIEPMKTRRDALRRSNYNSKTIARDVLLSLGIHPTMTPLNAHLDVLKDRFTAVDYESDLSTFRWDLVDPQGEANAEVADTEDKDAVPAVAAVTRQRLAPVAVMVAGHGAEIAKETQAQSRKVAPEGKPSKRGPYKKAGLQPEIQSKSAAAADTPQRKSSKGSAQPHPMSKVSSTYLADLSRFSRIDPYAAQTNLTSSSTPQSADKRKNGPPGAKNKHVRPDKGEPKKKKAPSARESTSTAKAKPSDEEMARKIVLAGKTPPAGSFSVKKPSAPIPTRPHSTLTTPSRPSGLRSSLSDTSPTDGIAVVIPSRSPSVVIVTPQASAKKGTPRKIEDLSNGTHYSEPPHVMYPCRWETCPAELHNRETLKKHIKKHCRAVDGVYACLWAGCSDSSNPISNVTQNEDSRQRRMQFKTDTKWAEHVESNHLGIGWGLSEGAAVIPSGAE